MDYLLRGSHHTGVSYGRFDHYRLIDTLRILPSTGIEAEPDFTEPVLGVEEGGLHSAEALMLARYFMYTQVYFHPVRRIYDIHLVDFLKEWLPGGQFSTSADEYLCMTDNEVTSALLEAARDSSKNGHLHAGRIVKRKHFKVLYDRNPTDVEINPEAGIAVCKALSDEFGEENFRHDRYSQRGDPPNFPVILRNGEYASSLVRSRTLKKIPVVSTDFVFADRSTYENAKEWLASNGDYILEYTTCHKIEFH